jgi:hypothetical protein
MEASVSECSVQPSLTTKDATGPPQMGKQHRRAREEQPVNEIPFRGCHETSVRCEDSRIKLTIVPAVHVAQT